MANERPENHVQPASRAKEELPVLTGRQNRRFEEFDLEFRVWIWRFVFDDVRGPTCTLVERTLELKLYSSARWVGFEG